MLGMLLSCFVREKKQLKEAAEWFCILQLHPIKPGLLRLPSEGSNDLLNHIQVL